MPASTQLLLWGIAVCIPVILNLAAKKTDAVGLSAMLLLTWVFGRVTAALYPVPEAMSLYPIVDAACGITAFVAYRSRPALWKLLLASLFMLQCILHVAFWAAWPAPGSLYRYVFANNALFLLELLCVSGPGGFSVVAHLVGSGVPDRLRPFRHVRFGSWR